MPKLFAKLLLPVFAALASSASATVVLDSLSPFAVTPVVPKIEAESADAIITLTQSYQYDSNANGGTAQSSYSLPLIGEVPTLQGLRSYGSHGHRTVLTGFAEAGQGWWVAGSFSNNERDRANASRAAAGLIGWGLDTGHSTFDISAGGYQSRDDQGSDTDATTMGAETRLGLNDQAMAYLSFFRTRFLSDEALIDDSNSNDATAGLAYQVRPSLRLAAGLKRQRYRARDQYSAFDMDAAFAEVRYQTAHQINIVLTADRRELRYLAPVNILGFPAEFQDRDRTQFGARLTRPVGIGLLGVEVLDNDIDSTYQLRPADKRVSSISFTIPLLAK